MPLGVSEMFWFVPSEEHWRSPAEPVAQGCGWNHVRASVMDVIEDAPVTTFAIGISPALKADVLAAGPQLFAGFR